MLNKISADCLRIVAGWLTLTDLLRAREVSRPIRRAASGLWPFVKIDLCIGAAFKVMRSRVGARLIWDAFPVIRRTVSVCEVLRYACAHGWLSKARWLVAYGEPSNNSGWMPRDHYLLESACGGGHRATARWVADHFGLGAGRAAGSSRRALVSACAGGHLATAQWLATRFGFTEEHRVFDEVLRAFRAACDNGHLATAQWLTERFDICVGRYGRREIDDRLCAACVHGQLAVVQWLVAHFCIWLRGVVVRSRDPLLRAADNGHHEVVRWLHAAIDEQDRRSKS